MHEPALYRVKVKTPTRVLMYAGSAHDEVTRMTAMTSTNLETLTEPERAGAENANKALFAPLRLGRTLLKHRVVMAPLTR
jgi:NADH:flavin oxidoreductase / NADH oxidase family